ncbi:imelysin family protein [Psychromarinibacter sp. C21-152]|uniref:Imelysin family protein n=1 Tax=Psychromarinibacter sediminicola TaxID=3033385 RepID=A0AAE3NS82_9RHOB|nr:imelysin family protein [Psychromarinibacter sediminicola]MDF0603333.1 imelysin family protein [Psychromarinibacter sediminicola]
MLRPLAACALLLWPGTAAAYDIGQIVDDHILPGYTALVDEAHDLAATAEQDCAADSPALRAAWNDAFDAWVRISHLRFGPAEEGDRAYALAFWPDARGFTPRQLGGLISAEDPVIETQAGFDELSVAARGFYAMEFLLYDEAFMTAEPEAYRCALVQGAARDIEANARAILDGWETGFADLLRNAGDNDTYRSRDEAAQVLLGAVVSELQFTSDTRLGRPLGTFERPRPRRAEARRSGRALRNVRLSLEGTRELALLLAADSPYVTGILEDAYARALEQVAALSHDPVFAGVDEPQGRLEVEILQQNIDRIRTLLGAELGPELGVAAGFNAMDGD